MQDYSYIHIYYKANQSANNTALLRIEYQITVTLDTGDLITTGVNQTKQFSIQGGSRLPMFFSKSKDYKAALVTLCWVYP